MVIGIREAVMALIALVAVYMLFVLMRMRRLRQPSSSRTNLSPALDNASLGIGEKSAPENREPPTISPAWDKVPAGLADGVLRQGLEQDILQLRDEVDSVRGELAALRADMLQELAHLRATQSVSPIYGDAMQLAAAGYEPAMIAERCGIARAEAELVVALAKSQER